MEYEHEHVKRDASGLDCPKIEVHFVVEPANFHVDSLTCSHDEIAKAKNQSLQRSFNFGRDQKQIFEQSLVMPSTWIKQKQHPDSFLRFQEQWQNKFAEITFDLELRSPGILSVIAASDFSDMFVYISIFEKENYPHVPLQIEKGFLIDNVELNDDHYARDQDQTVAANHLEWDHLSTLELSHLPKGQYVLGIAIPQAHWFLTKGVETCLSLDVMMEFIPKDASYTEEEGLLMQDDANQVIQVMNVFPPARQAMKLGDNLKLRIHLDRFVDFRDMASRTNDMAHLCQLQNLGDPKKFASATRFHYEGN